MHFQPTELANIVPYTKICISSEELQNNVQRIPTYLLHWILPNVLFVLMEIQTTQTGDKPHTRH